MKINCKMNSLIVTSTKAVLISTGQRYTKQYCMSIQIRYRSCNVLLPNSGSRYQRYQMLVSVMKTVLFLYRHVYWERGRPITHEWIDPWTLLLPGQHRWAQVGATDEPREFRLAGSRQDKRLERAIPLTTHLWYIFSITDTEMGQLNTYNPIYCNENKTLATLNPNQNWASMPIFRIYYV